MELRLRIAIVLLLVASSGCAVSSGTSGPSSPLPTVTHLPGIGLVTWTGGKSTRLADLKLETLGSQPNADVRVRVERVEGSLSEHRHGAGFVYSPHAGQQLAIGDRTVDIPPGGAGIVAPHGIAHVHRSPQGTSWLFICLEDVAGTSSATHGFVVYESPPLPSLPTGTHPGGAFTLGYTESLRLVELAPGGSSPLHYPTGYEALYVLEGAVDIVFSTSHTQVGEAQGHTVGPLEVVRLVNHQQTPSRILVFFASPGGEPYQVDLGGS